MCCSRLYTDNCLGKYPALTRQVVEDSVLSSISPPRKVKKRKKIGKLLLEKTANTCDMHGLCFFQKNHIVHLQRNCIVSFSTQWSKQGKNQYLF